MTMEIDLIIEKKLQEAFDISELKKRLPKEDFERIIKAEQKIIFRKEMYSLGMKNALRVYM